MNSEEAKKASDRMWGVLQHPTLTGIVRMILSFLEEAKNADPRNQWADLRLWKMDLSGAFTLIDFRPSDVHLMVSELQHDLVVVFLCGVFGWTGTPVAFQVLTWTILWELAQPGVLRGRAEMYTDDLIGVSFARDIDHDLAAARALCTALLGPTAVADDKTAVGTRLTVIGWDIDLEHLLVAVSRSNALKAFYGFVSVDSDGGIAVRTIERLASWAQRYGEICVYMQPFRHHLYNLLRGRGRHVTIYLTAHSKLVIWLYQALLALTVLVEHRLTRELRSFTTSMDR